MKYRSHRSHTKFQSICNSLLKELIKKNADEKVQTFLKRSNNVKNGYRINSPFRLLIIILIVPLDNVHSLT